MQTNNHRITVRNKRVKTPMSALSFGNYCITGVIATHRQINPGAGS